VLSELLRAVGVVGGVRGSRSGVDEEGGCSSLLEAVLPVACGLWVGC
jgi:hypothetical protein